MAKPAAFDREVKAAIAGAREQVKRTFVAEIRRQLDRVEQESGPAFTRRFIDGVKDRPIEDIDPFGRAFFTFHYLRDAVREAIEILRVTSPVDTGAYEASHNVFIDEDPLAPVVRKGDGGFPWQLGLLDRITDQSRVTITPTVEYARVIEEGTKRKKPWSTQAQVPASGVYRTAATAIQRRWVGIVIARYEWVQLDVMDAQYRRQPAIVLENAL